MIKRAAGPIINNALMTQLAAWSKAKAAKEAKLESLKQILAKSRPRLTPPSVEDPGIARANLLKRVARTPVRVPKMEKKPVPTNYPMSKVMDVFNSVVKKPALPPPSVVPPKQNLSQGELHNLLNPKTSEYQQGILVKLAALPPETRHKVMSWLRRVLGIDKAPEAPGATPDGVAEVSSGYDRLAAMQPPKM